ncbi:alpha/beta-Hydrolases superfamily protein [Rhynchospora pubera]|uniref:Alpha/beta-Hydrolases superfamily protein n=1 Tax=Rhynchospora pubera TaxID=906938 RepID=A0AAV8EM62_9POAL|nr:alpha/beta-Hydrolases superfamily protein [Rhynchospora pubera]
MFFFRSSTQLNLTFLYRLKHTISILSSHRLFKRHHLLPSIQQAIKMSSHVPSSPRFFWGDQPEESDYYASRGVKNHQSFYQSPYGRIFTQSFHPIDRETCEHVPIKGIVFMTHGFGSDTSWLFQNTAITYATWGYAVYCADLLGHGRSDGIPGYIGDFEAVAGASLSFFLSVRKDPVYADLPAFLFGESMGGAVTLLMYLRSPPDTWTGVILSAPLLIMLEDRKPSKLRLFLFGLLFGIAETWQVMPNKGVQNLFRDPDRVRIILANPRRYTGKPRVGTMRELARMCEYVQGSFTNVTVPLLMVYGTADGIIAPVGLKMLYEKARSRDKCLCQYLDFYHSLIQGESEHNRNKILEDMMEWIDERVEMYGCGITKTVKAEEVWE